MRAVLKLHAELVATGFYKRVWWREALTLAPCLALFAVGTSVGRAMPRIATVCLALGSVAAGWIGHDYIHGRGWWCALMRGFGGAFFLFCFM